MFGKNLILNAIVLIVLTIAVIVIVSHKVENPSEGFYFMRGFFLGFWWFQGMFFSVELVNFLLRNSIRNSWEISTASTIRMFFVVGICFLFFGVFSIPRDWISWKVIEWLFFVGFGFLLVGGYLIRRMRQRAKED